MAALIVPFLVYWLVLFAVVYVVTEYSQKYLYDETTPMHGLKVAGGSLLLAMMLTWTRTSYDTMLTSDITFTVLQAIVWFGVFVLILRFHPPHALMIGVLMMILVCGAATMAVRSMTTPRRELRQGRIDQLPTGPVRKTVSGGAAGMPKLEAGKSEPAKPAAGGS